MPHLLLSAAHKSSGKTILSIGICAELARRGRRVRPFKKGPDYIDPLWLSQAAGCPCHNLDFYTQGREELLAGFAAQLAGADLGLIEGNKGLYDGLDLDGSNSNAALAHLLGAPVVLVVDCAGMTRGIAPLLLGYRAFDPALHIAGVILNKVNGGRHEGKLRQVIAHYTDLPVLGAVQRAGELEIQERHLGLIPSNESGDAAARIESIRRLISDQVDLEALQAIAAQAPTPGTPLNPAAPATPGPRVRVGIARDAAFGFYYPGDLAALEAAGGVLVPFSPLADAELPEVDGLFIGGGFPETHMGALAANESLRLALRQYVEAGRPLYAECGGLMYLSRAIHWRGEIRPMVGVVPGEAVMGERPQGRGYVRLRETEQCPWRGLGLSGGNDIPGHEFHYSRLENLAPGQRYAFQVARGTGIDGSHDGLVYKGLLANYSHLRDVAAYPWTRGFLDQVRRHRRAGDPGGVGSKT